LRGSRGSEIKTVNMADAPPPAPTPASALALVPPPTPPPVPITYRERLAQFRILEEKRIELIEVYMNSGLLLHDAN
jgi:hypothetical protein